MKFSTQEDIEAPQAFVFDRGSDFAAFESRVRHHGAQVERKDQAAPKVGSRWDVRFPFRGKSRHLRVTLAGLEPSQGYQLDSESDGMMAQTDVMLVALSPSRTRLIVGIDVRARTLTARLLLQSMKLAKQKLSKRFKARVLDYAEDIEAAYRQSG